MRAPNAIRTLAQVIKLCLAFLRRRGTEAIVWNHGAGAFGGWGWDWARPEKPIEVGIFLNGRKIASAVADQTLTGDHVPPWASFCGFAYILPREYRSKVLHLSFKLASGRELTHSPCVIEPIPLDGAGAGEFCLEEIPTVILDGNGHDRPSVGAGEIQARVAINLQDLAIVKSRFAFASNDRTIHQVRAYTEYRSDLSYAIAFRNVYVDLENGTIFLADGRVWRSSTYLRNGDSLASASARIARGDVDGNIQEPITLLVTTMSWNYFHWHLDCLASWFGVSELLSFPSQVIAPPLTPLQSLSFGLLSNKPPLVADGLKFCQEVLVSSPFDGRGIRPERSIVRMFDRIREAAAVKSRSGVQSRMGECELLFISRKDSPRRALHNEDELFSRLHPFGFARLLLSEIDYLRQIQLFYNARCIVGLHGAGLTNIGFCAEGCQVFEIIPSSYINGCYRFLAAAKNLRHYWFVAPQADPFTLSIPEFMKFFEAHFNGHEAHFNRHSA
jgi:capsular polysaccharide biosynthesis protein